MSGGEKYHFFSVLFRSHTSNDKAEKRLWIKRGRNSSTAAGSIELR